MDVRPGAEKVSFAVERPKEAPGRLDDRQLSCRSLIQFHGAS